MVFPFGKIIESSNTGKNYSASEDNEKAFAICTLEGLNELFTDFHKEKNTNFSLDEEQIEKIGKMLGELTQTTSPNTSLILFAPCCPVSEKDCRADIKVTH